MELLGMVLGVTAVVLAAVSIWFAWRVDDRNNRLNLMFTQTLATIQGESGNIRSQLDNLVSTAWHELVVGRREVSPAGPSAEIEELRKKIEELQNAGFASVVRSLVDKLDQLERVQMRIVEHLLVRIGTSLRSVPMEQRDLALASFESYRRYFSGDLPIADIPETMVSPEELLEELRRIEE